MYDDASLEGVFNFMFFSTGREASHLNISSSAKGSKANGVFEFYQTFHFFYLLMPIAPGWAKAIHSCTPSSPVLRHRLQLLPGVSHLSGVRFQVSPPGILGS